MKVLFDNIIYFLQRSGGGSVYWSEIIKRALNDKTLDVTFIEPKVKANNIFRKELVLSPIITERLWLPFLRISEISVNVKEKLIFHSSYYRISSSKLAINIVTIHDFTSEKFFKGLRRFVHRFRKKRAIIKAKGIICISENTKTDLLNFYPEALNKRIQVIYNGVSDDFFKLKDYSLKDYSFFKGIATKKIVLYVGHRTTYKNFPLAVETVALLDESYNLVIVGEKLTKNELEFVEEKIPNRFLCFNGLLNKELNYLYNSAFCLIYPSSYEGFGIPILEAMKAGCPVVTTNKSSIPEVAGDAAIMIRSLSPENFSKEIYKLENTDLREDIIRKGFKQSSIFSWDKCYNEVITFYNEMYSS